MDTFDEKNVGGKSHATVPLRFLHQKSPTSNSLINITSSVVVVVIRSVVVVVIPGSVN